MFQSQSLKTDFVQDEKSFLEIYILISNIIHICFIKINRKRNKKNSSHYAHFFEQMSLFQMENLWQKHSASFEINLKKLKGIVC